MKVVLTGGGSGGHFYPLIAVAESLRELSKELKLLDPKIYYIAPEPYDEKALFDNDITFKKGVAGKRRLYFSIKNFFDFFKIGWGVLISIWQLFTIFPDVVFSKGGYAAFPVLVAARFFRIPVIIHDSDSVPGKVSIWSGKFAKSIAISYSEAASYFPEEKTALTGVPIRKELLIPAKSGAKQFLNLEDGVPTVLVLGGSQGSEPINRVILSALPELIEKYQIIHQTGPKNISYVKDVAGINLRGNNKASRYKPFGFLDVLATKMSAGAADVVISRAGSTYIFEIAIWGIPAILVPIPESVSHDQHSNAFSYAASGAAVVVEEKNLTPDILLFEINRVLSDKAAYQSMSDAAKRFTDGKAAKKIAKEIINTALSK